MHLLYIYKFANGYSYVGRTTERAKAQRRRNARNAAARQSRSLTLLRLWLLRGEQHTYEELPARYATKQEAEVAEDALMRSLPAVINARSPIGGKLANSSIECLLPAEDLDAAAQELIAGTAAFGSTEHRSKISKSMEGRELSAEHCASISRGKKGKPNWRKGKKGPYGADNPHTGMKRPPETGRRISAAKTGVKLGPQTQELVSKRMARRLLTQAKNTWKAGRPWDAYCMIYRNLGHFA